ncbi:heme exporter protein CcmD [Dokdonella koreensis]|uniref:Heme exporter protein D n=1 Tax=Dokdonella koreensis DS-123 TaxID=1300342 RepID=A0A167G915_9GAMM|nr:heme exporter protein CcmD [Dokdonella koreensis]ANB16282.1 Heme exporter protein D [Dokdonella koreensis DS-123]
MADFISMGGYGFYVWLSYAVFVVVLAIDYAAPRLRRRRVLKDLAAMLRRQQRRSGAAP